MNRTSAELQFVTALLERARRAGADWRAEAGATACEIEEFRLVLVTGLGGALDRIAVTDRHDRLLVGVEGTAVESAAKAALQTVLDDVRLASLLRRLRESKRAAAPWWAGLAAARPEVGSLLARA